MSEFHNELLQEVIARSGANENFHHSEFVEYACEILEAEGAISDFSLCGFRKMTKGLAVDAYSLDPDLGELVLIIGEFHTNPDPYIINRTGLDQVIKRPERFFMECLKSGFRQSLEEADPTAELAWDVWDRRKDINHVKVILVTNGCLSERIKELRESEAGEYRISREVWDLVRFERIVAAGRAREMLEIDFREFGGPGIPCLPAVTSNASVASYLLVLPGSILAELYERYGERLLEQNVRTFLQFRGKVNLGMRNTLADCPEMFFPYNNGISATADSVTFDRENRHLVSARNLQIVNGGQTTAAIMTARRKHRIDLTDVFVQAKLCVVPEEAVEEIVPKISEYANTQNKVNAADFFSNHPFHLRIEEFSRRIFAPTAPGSIVQTKYFYERSRGQYGNAQSRLTPAEKGKFLRQNPRTQMFTKTDLAKVENSFAGKPHIVSFGAQKNFAKFADDIGKAWERDPRGFNEEFYRDLCVKILLFRQLDRAILKSDWYDGGYKAQTVTYTLAKFQSMIRQRDLYLDLQNIWRAQQVPEDLLQEMLRVGEIVYGIIQSTPEGIKNVSEWCKKEACWQGVEANTIRLGASVLPLLIDAEEARSRARVGKRGQKDADEINAMAKVVEEGAAHWQGYLDWNEHAHKFTGKEANCLRIASSIPHKLPSEKQCQIILKAEQRAIDLGYPHRY